MNMIRLIQKQLKDKLKIVNRKFNKKGETLAETLVALLIAVLALVMLPMALVVSAKINNTIATSGKLRTVEVRPAVSGTYEHESQIKETVGVEIMTGAEYSVKVDGKEVSDVTIYKDTADYVFFNYLPSTSGTPGGE